MVETARCLVGDSNPGLLSTMRQILLLTDLVLVPVTPLQQHKDNTDNNEIKFDKIMIYKSENIILWMNDILSEINRK